MDMEFNTQIVQEQKTIITQKLIEHMEILQMPSFALSQHIEKMLADNPLLEQYTPEKDEIFEDAIQSYSESDEFKNTHESDEFLYYTKASVTLREYLHQQLLELKLTLRNRRITEYLIECLDADGYLRESTNEMAKVLKVNTSDLRHCIKILQALEPAGIGAKNIKECLLLQLKRKKVLNKDSMNIILNCFELLASKSFSKVSKQTGISKNEVEKVYAMVKSLNPRPGCNFRKDEPEPYIIPDIFLREENGRFILEFNNESLPALRINSYYMSLLKNSEPGREVKDYIKKNLSSAVELLRAIEQRKKTVLDIASYIVGFQEGFLKYGYGELKPLTMQMVADSLSIHVSTVSRAVNGKYIQTFKEIYELKFFFSAKIKAAVENKSAVSIKDIIKRIVRDEDKHKPLSDEQIKVKLEGEGIKVARRTISKYREELSILSAALRKC